MSTVREFKIPEGPEPMPIMETEDDDSFVVLGQSLSPEIDLSFNNLTIESIKSDAIDEGKSLLSQLEISAGVSTTPDLTEIKKSVELSNGASSTLSNLFPADFQAKIDMLIAENVKLRDIIVKNNAAMEFQHKKIVEWKEEVHNTHQLHKEKFAEAKKYITSLVQEKTYLKNEVDKSQEIRKLHEAEIFRLKEENQKRKQINVQGTQAVAPSISEKEELLSEIELLKKELKQAVSQINEAVVMKNEAVAKKTEVENFVSIVYSQKENLEKEKDLIEQEKNNIISEFHKQLRIKDEIIAQLKNEMKENEEAAKKKMSDCTSELTAVKSQIGRTSNLKEDLDNVRKQLMASQENITRLLQTNGVLEAQLTAEQERVKELRKSEVTKDDLFALQQQLDIYKADFEEERRMKETYKAEIKQLSTDFKQVQKRNGELQDELVGLKEHGWEYVSADRRTSSTSTAPSTMQYSCPICQFGFLSEQALENHVDRCLDLEKFLP